MTTLSDRLRKTPARLINAMRREDGVTTAEYAIGTCAATGLAGLLFHLLTGQQMLDLLWRIFTHALSALFNF